MVGLLVSLDFVQLVGDGLAVVERVEDHLFGRALIDLEEI